MELGCGWGSFCLYACERFPNSKIVAVSNSNSQREYITAQAKARGFNNLRVITCDITVFKLDDYKEAEFDRIVSIEMFEHLKNYEQLFQKLSTWLKADGKMFVHIFVHKDFPYHFEGDTWMAKYLFSGGTMPSDDLFFRFQENLKIQKHWRVNGMHYAWTNRDYLRNMDKNAKLVRQTFAETYGKDQVTRWWVMWRVFFLAMEECFAFNRGDEWFVSHYLFAK